MSPSVEPFPVQNLSELLSESLGKDIQVKQLEWRPLTAPGENFGSVMLAINVTVTRLNRTDTLHLVGKLPPTSAYLLDLFNSPVTFKKELLFYSSMAKEFMKLQLESGINEKDVSDLAPKYFGGRLGLKDPEVFDQQAVIVLENLKYNGYSTEDRIWGLDKVHTEFALDGLARLHALTIALKLKKPQLFQGMLSGVLTEVMSDTTEKCVIDMIRKAQADMNDIPEMKPYMDRVNKTVEHGIKANKHAGKAEEPWATLVHNDFWVNNMMFRHDQRGQLIDMKIVDFQLCIYDYGINDLIFFLVSSAKKDILDNKLDDMIDTYYFRFVEFLKTLQVDTERFTKQKFDEIVNRCATLKFNQCMMMAQVIQAPKATTTEFKEIKGEDLFLNQVDNDVYKQKLVHIVQLFDKRGWLIK